jgi:protein-tyrosine-phosphatase
VHLLFVCTGNTCRSPMAEFLARFKANSLGLDWEVHSAGLHATPGHPMSAKSRLALLRRKIDVDKHESTPVSESLVRRADYVFTMTEAHRQDLLFRFPFSADKVFTIGAFAEGGAEGAFDVVDPFGESDDIYESCATILEAHIEQLVEKLLSEGPHTE